MKQYKRIQDEYSHPTPYLSVKIYNPINPDFKEVVTMIIDTGSGKTFIPEEIKTKLGNLPKSAKQLIIKNPNKIGSPQITYSFLINLELDDDIEQKQHKVEVLFTPRRYGILGRDILNQYKIILDSPKEQWAFKCRWDSGIKCDDKSCILKVTTSNLIV